MTSLLDGARRLVSRGSDLGDRIEALGRASEAARGRLDDRVVDDAEAIVERAARRLRSDRRPHGRRDRRRDRVGQVVDVQRAGRARALRRRRTPSHDVVGDRVRLGQGRRRASCSSGSASRRATRSCATPCSTSARRTSELQGVVLLDLPDHDSTEVVPPPRGRPAGRARRPAGVGARPAEVRRRRDPRPLPRPAGHHQDVMLVVLNHIDAVPDDRRQSMLDDVRRLLDADGLDRVPVLADQRPHGRGHRRAARPRSRDRVRPRRSPARGSRPTCAARPRRLHEATGDSGHPELSQERDRRARGRVRRRRRGPDRGRGGRAVDPGARPPATGWPVTSWLSRLQARPAQAAPPRPRQGRAGSSPAGRRTVHARGRPRCSAPGSTPRCAPLADEVSARLSRPWAEAVRRASVSRLPELSDRLDAALGRHRPRRRPDARVGRARARRCSGCCCSPPSPGLVWSAVAARATRGSVSTDPDAGRRRASRCRCCCCSAAWCSGLLLALLCRLLVVGDRAARGPARPTGGCGRRSRGGRRAGRGTGRAPSWRRTTTCATGLARALQLARLHVHRRHLRPCLSTALARGRRPLSAPLPRLGRTFHETLHDQE